MAVPKIFTTNDGRYAVTVNGHTYRFDGTPGQAITVGGQRVVVPPHPMKPSPAASPAAPAAIPTSGAVPGGVDPSLGFLTPEQMQQYLSENFGISSERIGADQNLADVLAQDPFVKQQIEDNYQHSWRDTTDNLAERGLAAEGVASQDVIKGGGQAGGGVASSYLWDVDRQQKLSAAQQASAVQRAQERHDAIIGNLNNRKTTTDQNWLAQSRANASAQAAATAAAAAAAPTAQGPHGVQGATPAGYTPGAPGVAQPATPTTYASGPPPDKNHYWNGVRWVRK